MSATFWNLRRRIRQLEASGKAGKSEAKGVAAEGGKQAKGKPVAGNHREG